MKICAYCGIERPDSVQNCPSCGGFEFKNKCSNCGTVYEENYCPKCGLKSGAQAKRCPRCGTQYYFKYCPNCGPTGYNTAVKFSSTPTQPVAKKNSLIWLWVIGWIVMFPIPLTVLIVKNHKLNIGAKAAIIAATWIVFLAIGIVSGITNSNTESSDSTISTTGTSQVQQTVSDGE